MRFESRKLGTERLGVFFEWSTFDQTWRDRDAGGAAGRPAMPALYRNRMTVTPLVKFAITPQLTRGRRREHHRAGCARRVLVRLADGERRDRLAAGSTSAGSRRPACSTTSTPRSPFARAPTSLESDLVYERYLGQADYALPLGAGIACFVSGMVGSITGEAPLFERFSLGDSRTLRGWDKYDIAPAGGDRMFHASVEYRYRVLALFLDSGSVWDTGTNRKVRFSTGFGFTPGPGVLHGGLPAQHR